MKIAGFIENLRTYLDGLSWTSDDGKQTTSLSAVFTYPNFLHTEGYPFAIIGDTGTTSESLDNRTISADTEIKITIAGNWEAVEAQDDDVRREEVALRIREATDAIKTNIMKIDTLQTLGGDWTMEFRYGDIEDEPEYNILYREFYLICKEIIDR